MTQTVWQGREWLVVDGVWTREGDVQGVTFLNASIYCDTPLLLHPANYLLVNLEYSTRVDGQPQLVRSKQILLLQNLQKQPQLGSTSLSINSESQDILFDCD